MSDYVLQNDELYHWGVKGMKWGVRRYQNKDGTLTAEGKKRYGYDHTTNTDGFTIPSGSTVYRVSVNKNASNSGATYVTMHGVDRDMYKGAWAKEIAKNQSGNPNAKVYEQSFKTTTALKIPSHDEVKKVEQQLKKDPKIIAEVGEAWANQYMKTNAKQLQAMRSIADNDQFMESGREYCKKFLEAHGNVSTQFADTYKSSSDEGSLYRFSAAVGTSDYVKAAVIRELSNRGYNAMTDEFGVGGGSTKDSYIKEGVQPLLVFDSNSIAQTGSSKVTAKERKQSTQRYANWYSEQNRK